jgi:hypothetical protein
MFSRLEKHHIRSFNIFNRQIANSRTSAPAARGATTGGGRDVEILDV